MPTVTCPSCANDVRVKSDSVGRKIRCPECRKGFTAKGDEGEVPRRAKADEADAAERPSDRQRPSSRLPLVLLSVGLVGVLLLVVGGTVAFLALRPRPDVAPKQTHQPGDPVIPQTEEWPDAAGGVRQGDVLVRVSGVKLVSDVRFGDGGVSRPGGFWRVSLEVVNNGTAPLGYRSWAADRSPASARMTFLPAGQPFDRAAKQEAQFDPGVGKRIAGQTDAAEIAPGKAHADTLFFPAPAQPNGGNLWLELESRNVGGNGTLRLRVSGALIDASRVTPRQEDAPTEIVVPEGWLAADAPARLGDVELRIKGVEVNTVTLLGKDGKETPSAGAYLIFRLGVKNLGKRKQWYRHPHDRGPVNFGLSLTDDVGNGFTFALPDTQAVVGQQPLKPVEVPAGGEIEDLLVFNRAGLGKGKELRLAFPVNSAHPDGVLADPSSGRRVLWKIDQAAALKSAEPDAETKARVRDLVKQLKHEQPEERIKAAEELAKLGFKASGGASRALILATGDSSREVRVTALDALKKVNPDLHGPVSELIKPISKEERLFLNNGPRPEAVKAIARLGKQGKAATPVLLSYKTRIAKAGGWQQVPLVVAALVVVAPDDPNVTKALASWLLEDADAASRQVEAEALAKMKDGASAAGSLAKALAGDKQARVRKAAAETLGELGVKDEEAVKALMAAKTDQDAMVREAARGALEKVGK